MVANNGHPTSFCAYLMKPKDLPNVRTQSLKPARWDSIEQSQNCRKVSEHMQRVYKLVHRSCERAHEIRVVEKVVRHCQCVPEDAVSGVGRPCIVEADDFAGFAISEKILCELVGSAGEVVCEV